MSESDIDMDRAMQGIDCEVPKITWTNCSHAMPPNNSLEIIIQYSLSGHKECIRGKDLHVLKAIWDTCTDVYWTPYTPEKWKELKNE